MTDQEKLERIKKQWSFFLDREPEEIFNSNMQHCMAGSMQNCFDLIWLIKTLEKKLQEPK